MQDISIVSNLFFKQNWKIFGVFFLVFAISQISTRVIKEETQKKIFGFDDVMSNAFGLRGFNGTWISGNYFTLYLKGMIKIASFFPDNEFTFRDADGNFNKINMDDLSVTQILSRAALVIL